MNDGRLTQIHSEWATAKGWYPASLGGYSYEMTVAIIDNAHAAITDLLHALADAETRAARDAPRLAAADNIAAMSPLYDDMSSEEVVVLRCVFCEGQEDGMNQVFLHADDCPWQALVATPRTVTGDTKPKD